MKQWLGQLWSRALRAAWALHLSVYPSLCGVFWFCKVYLVTEQSKGFSRVWTYFSLNALSILCSMCMPRSIDQTRVHTSLAENKVKALVFLKTYCIYIYFFVEKRQFPRREKLITPATFLLWCLTKVYWSQSLNKIGGFRCWFRLSFQQ